MKRLLLFLREFLSNFVKKRKAVSAFLTPAVILVVGIIVLAVLSDNGGSYKKGTEIMINADLYTSESYSSNIKNSVDSNFETPPERFTSSTPSKTKSNSSSGRVSSNKAESSTDDDNKNCSTCQKIMYDKNNGKRWFAQSENFSVRGVPLADTNILTKAYAFYSDMSYTVELVFKNPILIYSENSHSVQDYLNKLEAAFNGYRFRVLDVDSTGIISVEGALYGEPKGGRYTISHEKSGEVLNLSDGQTLYYKGGYLCKNSKASDVALVPENPENFN